MFEYSKLNEIALDNTTLKNTIINTITNNIFVRNGFNKNIHNLSDNQILKGIHYLLESNIIPYVCIGLNNIIEWTPVKLFQSVYFMVKANNKFWIVERNAYKSTVVLTITLKDYLSRLYEIGETSNYINPKYCPPSADFQSALSNLKNDAAFIKQDKYNNNNKINHFLYKYNNNIYYISVVYLNGSIYIFKPAIFATINENKTTDQADLHI